MFKPFVVKNFSDITVGVFFSLQQSVLHRAEMEENVSLLIRVNAEKDSWGNPVN